MDDYLTTDEAAERLGYTAQHVRRLLRENRLEGRKIGRVWAVREASVKEFAGQRANFELPLDN